MPLGSHLELPFPLLSPLLARLPPLPLLSCPSLILRPTARRPPATQTAAGRLPLGTPGQSTGAPHSHIRIVPHRSPNQSSLEGHLHDDTPTYCSKSLQFHQSFDERRRGSAVSEGSTSTPGATFADMARGYSKKDLEDMERPTSGPVPLTNFVRLQSGRSRKGNKNWRPLQPSELGGAEQDVEATGSSSPLNVSDFRPLQSPHPSAAHLAHPKPSPFNPIPMQTAPNVENNTNDIRASPNDESDHLAPTDARFDVLENYVRLFGKLPDLIRLHEQTGDFDGQIVFIGHPNRDVSAHQWSSGSFQWVNIGQWSHTRCRMEGFLASQRPLKTSFTYNTLEYFKYAAYDREYQIKEFGRLIEKPDEPGPSFLTEGDRTASLSTTSGSPHDVSSTFAWLGGPDETPNLPSTVHPSSRNITREHLEDPFVTPAKPPRSVIPASLNNREAGTDTDGSMDFDYEFPLKLNPASVPFKTRKTNVDLNHQLAYIQHKCEQIDKMQELPRESETPLQLRDVGFGEEASSLFATPAAPLNTSRVQGPLSPEDIQNRQQLKDRLAALGDQARRPSQSIERRVAIPDVPMLNTNIRALFPPGLTVANPYRGVSTLNANAAPYTRMPTVPSTLEDSQSEELTITAPPAANLCFSDPDDARQSHAREIANGFGQQAPTRQNLNGPFFAESMPTAHDPTTALAFRVSDEEMLSNWFRDGQRPIRQQEYAKTLIASASTINKGRRFGVIGEGAPKAQDQTNYVNTSFLTRVLENLSEYAEESRTGVRSSYFTRAWKPAQPALCDPSPEGNQSFFEKRPVAAPRMQRAPVGPPATLRPNLPGSVGPSSSGTRTRYGSVAEGAYDRW